MKKFLLIFLSIFVLFLNEVNAGGPISGGPVAGGEAGTGLYYVTSQAEPSLTNEVVLSAVGIALAQSATYAAMRNLLDLEVGIDFYSVTAADAVFQPLDADLTIYAGITPSANVQSLLGAVNYAAMRSQLEVATLNVSFTYNAMVGTDDFMFGRAFTQACTVANYGGVLHLGTNIIGRLYICNGTTDLTNPMDIAANCDACDSADTTFDGGEDRELAPDGVVAVGVGYRLAFVTNTVAGGPGFFDFDVNLTVD